MLFIILVSPFNDSIQNCTPTVSPPNLSLFHNLNVILLLFLCLTLMVKQLTIC